MIDYRLEKHKDSRMWFVQRRVGGKWVPTQSDVETDQLFYTKQEALEDAKINIQNEKIWFI